MGRVKDFYLNQQEQSPELAKMQKIMDEIAKEKDIGWYSAEDKDKEYTDHWEKVCEESKPF